MTGELFKITEELQLEDKELHLLRIEPSSTHQYLRTGQAHLQPLPISGDLESQVSRNALHSNERQKNWIFFEFEECVFNLKFEDKHV